VTKRDPAEWIRELAFLAVATDAQPRTSTLIGYDCPPDFDWWGHWCRALEEAEAAAAANPSTWTAVADHSSPSKRVTRSRRRALSDVEQRCIETFRACWEPFASPKDRDSLWRFDVERLLRECADQHGTRCTVRLARAAFEAIGEVYDPQYRARKGGW